MLLLVACSAADEDPSCEGAGGADVSAIGDQLLASIDLEIDGAARGIHPRQVGTRR
jgi:hypothetical protein